MCHSSRSNGNRDSESGMLLIEALVAMTIVAMVTISYIGIRTDALIDATRARNWRLAREIAEEKLSAVMAGAHEMQPESRQIIEIEKYENFSYMIVLGESGVADIEAEVANEAAGEDTDAKEKVQWQRDRQDLRRARDRGLDAMEYEEQQQLDDIEERLAEKAPSEEDFEEVAVVVYFPKLDADFPGQQEALLIKARISTLAISGMTPEQASSLADSESSEGDPIDPASGSTAGLTGGSGR
jgi:hypothetical protein